MPPTDDAYPAHDPENRCGRYILDRHGNPVPEPDLFKWAEALEQSYIDGTHWVAHTELAHGHRVSTIFLALDHNVERIIDPKGGHPPILYETMVFNDYGPLPNGDAPQITSVDQMRDWDWTCQRYATREEALAGHQAALTELKLYLQEREGEDVTRRC